MGANASTTAAAAQSASTLVENAIAEYPVVVFSKSYCPYCKKAKLALADAGAQSSNVKVFELNQMGKQGKLIQTYLAQKTGRSTVPNVFIAAKTIGGGDETAALHRNGQLAPLLSQAHAT